MVVTVEGTPQEIAALVLVLRERQEDPVEISCSEDTAQFIKNSVKAIHDRQKGSK